MGKLERQSHINYLNHKQFIKGFEKIFQGRNNYDILLMKNDSITLIVDFYKSRQTKTDIFALY